MHRHDEAGERTVLYDCLGAVAAFICMPCLDYIMSHASRVQHGVLNHAEEQPFLSRSR